MAPDPVFSALELASMSMDWKWERRPAVHVRQLVHVQQLAEHDAELVEEVRVGGIAALRGVATRDGLAVHNAYWLTQSGEKSEAHEKCVLLHETHAKLFPPTGRASDAGPPEDVLPAAAADALAERWVVLFQDGEVEVVPANWVSLETEEEATDEVAMMTALAKHRLLVDAVQDSGLRAMRLSGKPIHVARCRDSDGAKGRHLEKCVVLNDAVKGQRKVVLFDFGILQVVPAEWVSHQPTEAAGRLNEQALRVYALHTQHVSIEHAHGIRSHQSELEVSESCRARNERLHEASHIARSSLWTVQLEELPYDHVDICRKILACQARNETERWGIAKAPGLIKLSAMVLIPAALGIVPFVIKLGGAQRQCTMGEEGELLVPCAEIDKNAFILTCLLWLVGCALCLLEIYRTQLRPLGFGHMQHYAYVYSSAGGTFCLLEYLFYEKVPPGLATQVLFHMGCLVGSIWGCE